jgi:hypothetical protein
MVFELRPPERPSSDLLFDQKHLDEKHQRSNSSLKFDLGHWHNGGDIRKKERD